MAGPASSDQEELLYAAIDLKRTRAQRTLSASNHVLRDRRVDVYDRMLRHRLAILKRVRHLDSAHPPVPNQQYHYHYDHLYDHLYEGNAMSQFKKQFLVGIIAATAAAGACTNVLAADPIKIGVAVGLSGANSVVAPAVVKSSQLAVEQINAAGGILGRQVQLEITDDASGAVGAQKAYDTLVFQNNVDAIISMETSAARNAALPVVARGKKPFIYTSFYEGRSCSPWMYVNGWVPEQQVAPVSTTS